MRELNMRSDLAATTRALIVQYDDYYLHQGTLVIKNPSPMPRVTLYAAGKFRMFAGSDVGAVCDRNAIRCTIVGAARLSGLALRATHV